jgi:hypothetical protein
VNLDFSAFRDFTLTERFKLRPTRKFAYSREILAGRVNIRGNACGGRQPEPFGNCSGAHQTAWRREEA